MALVFFALVCDMDSADEKLVSQTLAGDRDAFGLLVHKYQEMVFAYAFQKVRNETDAQDVMQEVFLRAYRNLYALRHPHRFRSWLYTIMSNECNRWLARAAKTREREVALVDAAEDDLRVDPAHTAPTDGWRVDLERAIAALSDENRIAVSMFYMGDCSLKEISEFLGVSVNAVKGKLHRARQQLGSALSERYGKLLKSRKLRGGFLMQMMEQIRHTPAPTMGFAWSGASVGKTVFSLITALCILIGLIGVRNDSSTELSANQIGTPSSVASRLPIEVALIEPVSYSTRASIPGVPQPTGKRSLGGSSRASMEQRRQSNERGSASGSSGAKRANPQFAAVASESDSDKLAFSGRVVDTDGNPVAQAKILHYSSWGHEVVTVAYTAADGVYYFEISDPEVISLLNKRKELEGTDRFTVNSVIADHALSYQEIVVIHPHFPLWWRHLGEMNTSNAEIRLQKPETISGRVISSAGNAIQNAEAQIGDLYHDAEEMFSIPDQERTARWELDERVVKTDENGEFEIQWAPSSQIAVLDIQAPEYAKESFRAPSGVVGMEFRLRSESRIEGRVNYASTGESAIGATVGFVRTSSDVWRGQAKRGKTTVDANGNFFLTNLGPGGYDLYLDSGLDGWKAAAKKTSVTEGQTVSNLNFKLERCGVITGRVTYLETGEPIADHHVFVRDEAHPDSLYLYSTQTNEAGVYSFQAVPGRAFVSTSGPEGGTYEDVHGRRSREVHVREDGIVTVDFRFSKGIAVIVRTVTDSGRPINGVRLWAVNAEVFGSTDKDGEFAVQNLSNGQQLRLHAEHFEMALRGSAEIKVKPGITVEIPMKNYEQVTVSGRVVNEKGEPISGATISYMPGGSGARGSGLIEVATTNSNGQYRGVRFNEGDKFSIWATANGYYLADTDDFTAKGGMSQIPDLVLAPATAINTASEQKEERRAQARYCPDAKAERFRSLVGKPAPELAIGEWLSGGPVSLNNLKGKTIALHFWNIRNLSGDHMALRALDAFHRTHRGKGFVCITICHHSADVTEIEQHITQTSIDHPVGLDSPTKRDGSGDTTFERYDITTEAPIVLINAAGEIIGASSISDLGGQLRLLFKD